MNTELFWSRVDIRGEDECWPWIALTDEDGYGRFAVDRKARGAHRVAYCLGKGIHIDDLPSTSHVCHSCDNPPCCNPKHLWTGSETENVDDRHSKGRDARGAKQHLSIFKDDDIRAIRKLHASGTMQIDIALMYSTTQGTIGKIVRRETWRHVL